MLIPYVIEKNGHGERSMDIFSRLLDDRIIFLNGAVESGSAGLMIAQLLYLEAKDPEKPVFFYINSPGGSVSDGLAIADTMKHIKCPVTTICVGTAASMGSVLLASGEKGQRLILPHSEVLIHQPMISGGIDGQCSDIRIHSDHLLRLRDELEKLLSEATGQPIERIHSDCERDHYLTACEAVEYGICDKIIEI